MRNLSELTQKTEIHFPEYLSFGSVEKFFDYLSGNSIDVRYELTIRGLKSSRESQGISNERYAYNISGTMTHFPKQGGFGMSPFSCMREPEFRKPNFSGIKFDTIPGYDVQEHNPEQIKLWEKVKDLSEKYFSKK